MQVKHLNCGFASPFTCSKNTFLKASSKELQNTTTTGEKLFENNIQDLKITTREN